MPRFARILCMYAHRCTDQVLRCIRRRVSACHIALRHGTPASDCH